MNRSRFISPGPVGMIVPGVTSSLANDSVYKALDGSLLQKSKYNKLSQLIGQIYTYTEPAVIQNQIGVANDYCPFFAYQNGYFYTAAYASPLSLYYATDPSGTLTKVTLPNGSYSTTSVAACDLVYNGTEWLYMVATMGGSGTYGFMLFRSTNGTTWVAVAGSPAVASLATITSSAILPYSGGAYIYCNFGGTYYGYKYVNGGTLTADTGVTATLGNAIGGNFCAFDGTNVYAYGTTGYQSKPFGSSTITNLATSVNLGQCWPLPTAGAYAFIGEGSMVNYTTNSFSTITTVQGPDYPGANIIANAQTAPTLQDFWDDGTNLNFVGALTVPNSNAVRVYVVQFNKTTYAVSLRNSLTFSGINTTYQITYRDSVLVITHKGSARFVSYGVSVDAGTIISAPSKNLGATMNSAVSYTVVNAGTYTPAQRSYTSQLYPRYYAATGKVHGINASNTAAYIPSVRTFVADYDTVNYFRLPAVDFTGLSLNNSTKSIYGAMPVSWLIKAQ